MAALRTAASSSFRSAPRLTSVGVSSNVAGRRAGAGASFKASPSASRGFATSRAAREQKGPVDGSPPPAADSSTRTNRTALFGGIAIAALAAGSFLYMGRDSKKSALNVGPEGLNKTTGSKARAQGNAPADGISRAAGKASASASAGDMKLGTQADYQTVYNAIAERLEKDPSYDDGSYGPVLVRLAWHSSGTYDKDSKTGGSNGATMRFAPEADHGANAGLLAARNFLEPIKQMFPWVTYSDLWTLGGVVAVQEMGGPKIPWRPGRSDREQEHCAPDGRLPDGDKGSDHLRHIFYRMGFNDQEIVALSGAHAVGRCHADRSGFDGPWQHSPTSFNNEYFNLLLNEKWSWKKWDGPKQFEDKSTGQLMMLPTDMALVQDSAFKKWVQKYAENEDMFFDHFSKAFSTLLELGVPEENFKKFEPVSEGGRQYHLKTSAEQENA